MCTHAAYFTPSEFHPVTIFVTLALVFLVVAVVGFFSFGGFGGGGGVSGIHPHICSGFVCVWIKKKAAPAAAAAAAAYAAV